MAVLTRDASDPIADLSGKERKNAGTLLRPPIRWALGTAAAPGLPASICLQDPYSLRVVWEKPAELPAAPSGYV